MKFTDDDLKRLKASGITSIAGVVKGEHLSFDILALLARLEAAEKLILLRGTVIQMERNTRKIETAAWAWRKAAGK